MVAWQCWMNRFGWHGVIAGDSGSLLRFGIGKNQNVSVCMYFLPKPFGKLQHFEQDQLLLSLVPGGRVGDGLGIGVGVWILHW